METPRLQQHFNKVIAPALREKFSYGNVMQIPRIEKIVVHVGTGTKSNYNINAVKENLKKITGQHPVETLAKKSISNFKSREGQVIGIKVTLRGRRMYEFMDRLVNLVFPRVHDFRGLPATGFDKQGNYSVGMKDQLAFPEMKAESMEQLHGLQLTVSTTAKSAEEGYELLKLFGFPLQDREVKKKGKSAKK